MTIIDVRSPEEFNSGHVTVSVNIPLQEIPDRVEELKAMSPPLVLCCASGNRSGQAMSFLISKGVDCENGGSWRAVETKLTN